MSTMSLDNFLTQAGSQKKRDGRRKGGVSDANATWDSRSHGRMDPEEDTREVGNRESSEHRVTAHTEKMLDRKRANGIKPVSNVAKKLDGFMERMGMGEQQVFDLEDKLATAMPRVGALEKMHAARDS